MSGRLLALGEFLAGMTGELITLDLTPAPVVPRVHVQVLQVGAQQQLPALDAWPTHTQIGAFR